MSFSAPQAQYIPPPQAPAAPATPPMFGQVQQPGQKPQPKSQQQTFLGAFDLPSMGQLGQKTLLGS
jgi:hypothetical protein